MVAILVGLCQSPCIGRCGTAWHIGRCVAIGMWCEKAAKTRSSWWGWLCHGESISSMSCGCGVSIVGYTSSRVQYNLPTTPKPCGSFPRFFATIKWSPICNKHMWIKRLTRRGFTCAYRGAGVRVKLSYLGGKASICITLVHTNLLDNLSSFMSRYFCTLPKIVFGTVPWRTVSHRMKTIQSTVSFAFPVAWFFALCLTDVVLSPCCPYGTGVVHSGPNP